MEFLNVQTTVNKALSKVVDNSAELRAKFIIWFNEISRDILTQPRIWSFLAQSSTLAIAGDQITVPAGTSEIISMEIGQAFLTRDDQISEETASAYTTGSGAIPTGYTLSPEGIVTFYPGATGNCILTVETDLPADYADNDTPTIFPLAFEGLFVVGLRMHNYDYDKDGRYQKEVSLYQYEMSKAKEWDNRRKPRPHMTPRAYTRATK